MENRVRVQHYRIARSFSEGEPIRYYRGSGFHTVFGQHPEEKPAERGGLTEATTVIDGQCFTEFANCSIKDSFCYRTGRQIAVGRLRKHIEPLGYTITKAGIVERVGVQ